MFIYFTFTLFSGCFRVALFIKQTHSMLSTMNLLQKILIFFITNI